MEPRLEREGCENDGLGKVERVGVEGLRRPVGDVEQ